MAIHIRKIAKHSWVITLRVIALLLIIVAVTLGLLLGTEAGRVSLAQQGAAAYSLYSGDELKLNGIHSASLGSWQLQSLNWSPLNSAMSVQLQQLDVSWNWRFALKNRWWLPEVSLAKLEVNLADSTKQDTNVVRDYSNLWQQLPAMRLEQLQIDNIVINRPRYPSLSLALSAQADINWGVVPARFIVSVLDNESANELAMHLSAEGLDQFRFKGAMIASAQKNWAQWLKWEIDQDIEANWDIFVDYSTANQLKLDVVQASLPWDDHRFQMLGKVDYLIEERQFNFDHLAMQLDSQPASVNGWINRKESELDIEVNKWALDPLLNYFQVEQSAGIIDGSLRWFGGWRTPRINGQVDAVGQWNNIPVSATIKSDATSSGLLIDQGEIIAGKNSLNLTGEVDWRTNQLLLSYDTSLNRGKFFNTLFEQLPPSLDFSSQLEGKIEGKITEPVINYSGRTQVGYLGDQYQASISGVVDQKTLTVTNYALFGEKAHLSGSAELIYSGNQWQTNVEVKELDSDLLELFNIQLPIDWHANLSGNFAAQSIKEDFSLTGNATLLGDYEQQPFNAALDIIDVNKASIQLGNSYIRIGPSFVEGSGLANWQTPNWDFKLTHTDFSLALIRPWISQWPELLNSLELNLTGETVLSNVWSKPIIETQSTLSGEWFDRPLTADVNIKPKSLNQWQVSLENFQWFNGEFSYQGDLDAFNLDINGLVEVAQWSLIDFIAFNQVVLARSLEMPISLLGDISAQLKIDGSLSKFVAGGQLNFLGSYEQQRLTATAEIETLTPQQINIKALNSQWSDNTTDMNGRYNWSDGDFWLSVAASVSNVEPLADLAAPFIVDPILQQSIQRWSGNLDATIIAHNDTGDAYIEGTVDSNGQWFDLEYSLNWQGEGSWNNVLTQRLNAQWGEATFIANVDLNNQQLVGAIELEKITMTQLKRLYPAAPSDLSGQLDSIISVSGTLAEPSFSFDANAQGVWNANEIDHQWQAKVDTKWEQQGWSIDDINIAVDGGGQINLTGLGQGRFGQLLLTAEIPQTGYWIQDTELGPGQSSIKLKVNGDLLKPEIELDSSWQAEVWPILLTSKIRTTTDKINVSGTIFSEGQNRVKANVELPRMSWLDLQAQWQTTPFSFNVAIHSPLSVLDPFFVNRPNQSLSGLLAGQLSFGGSFEQPSWQGEIEWRDGKFENISSGTLINDIDLTFIAKDTQFSLIGFANDGRNGLLEVNGGIQFNPQIDDLFNHEFGLNFKAFNANLISDTQIDATMTGGISATGQYHNLLVSGSFDVSPLNLQTETFLLDGVPQLNIVSSLDEVAEEELKAPFYWPSGRLDVGLIANSRANLYGQGISAELAGSLEVTGEFSEPTISGRFNVVRGTYSGLGKVFSVSGGSVQIQNNQLVFNVEANYNEAGLNVLLNIAGTQDELTLQLSSVPALDQNELLAQLVFGKSIENISEFQAVQLAYLVNNIRTGTTSFDLIGATRQELTLDALIIDPQTDEEGNLGVNVRAGKYLNNYLYLEVEQNVGSDEGFRSSLQLQVTPNTYLELFAEETLGNGGAELKWSIDY